MGIEMINISTEYSKIEVFLSRLNINFDLIYPIYW